MSKLITNQNDIADADTADLVFTYNELEGKSIKKFESRGAAERRVANAILAATDRAGHKGVQVGKKPQVADGKVKNTESEAPETVPTAKAAKAPAVKAVKEQAPKGAAKAPKQAQVESGTENTVSTKAQAENTVAAQGLKVMSATDLAITKSGLRPESFRGQILQTIIDNPGIEKTAVVLMHGAYTADVLCKFKRLGLITEARV